jgi:hypothetical protein
MSGVSSSLAFIWSKCVGYQVDILDNGVEQFAVSVQLLMGKGRFDEMATIISSLVRARF